MAQVSIALSGPGTQLFSSLVQPAPSGSDSPVLFSPHSTLSNLLTSSLLLLSVPSILVGPVGSTYESWYVRHPSTPPTSVSPFLAHFCWTFYHSITRRFLTTYGLQLTSEKVVLSFFITVFLPTACLLSFLIVQCRASIQLEQKIIPTMMVAEGCDIRRFLARVSSAHPLWPTCPLPLSALVQCADSVPVIVLHSALHHVETSNRHPWFLRRVWQASPLCL